MCVYGGGGVLGNGDGDDDGVGLQTETEKEKGGLVAEVREGDDGGRVNGYEAEDEDEVMIMVACMGMTDIMGQSIGRGVL